MMRFSGLRSEILFSLALLIVAAFLLFGILALRFFEQELVRGEIAHLSSLMTLAEEAVSANGKVSEDFNTIFLDRICQRSQCRGWRIFDKSLELFSASTRESTEPDAEELRQRVRITEELQMKLEFSSWIGFYKKNVETVIFAVPVLNEGRFNGVLQISFSLESVRNELLKSFKSFLIYTFGVAVVLLGMGYYLLQRNVISPAQKLLIATKAISRGNLTERLPLEGPREFFQLAEAYNAMAYSLEQSKRETDNYIKSLREVNVKLRHARNEILMSEKMASVGQLAAGLAHEIGNPLSALIGYLELLKRTQPDLSLHHHDLIERSLIETGRIDVLVRELLDYARPKDGALLEKIDITSEAKYCLNLLNNQGRFKGITVNDCLPEKDIVLLLNRSHFQQIFMNLLLNASDACGEGDEISVNANETSDELIVTVKDTGSGIAAQDLNRIFDPFYTTKPPGQGTGLGLAICYRLVADMGGHIEVDSSLGKGSEFRVILPLKIVQKLHQ